jgi:FKBP-type peptidyl-prolyl cis-trans isomerase FklB
MKVKFLLLSGAVALLAAGGCKQMKSSPATEIKTANDSLSYSIGVSVGMNLKGNFKQSNMDSVVNSALLAKGIQDILDSANLSITEAQSEQIIQSYFAKLQEKQQAEAEAKSKAALEEANKFFEENKSKPNIQTTASGLQYEVIKEGTGEKPAATDKVKVHYHGTLLNGKTFDSSVDRGEPEEFLLNQVIPGWTEGVQLMKKGAKYKFYIPSNLAYGERGAGGVIPPNAALIFEVELLEITKQ